MLTLQGCKSIAVVAKLKWMKVPLYCSVHSDSGGNLAAMARLTKEKLCKELRCFRKWTFGQISRVIPWWLLSRRTLPGCSFGIFYWASLWNIAMNKMSYCWIDISLSFPCGLTADSVMKNNNSIFQFIPSEHTSPTHHGHRTLSTLQHYWSGLLSA